jgi:hypothetical protein
MKEELQMEGRMGEFARPAGPGWAVGGFTNRAISFAVAAVILGGWPGIPAASAQTAKRPAPAPVHTAAVKRVVPTVHAGVVKLRVGTKTSSYHRTTQARPAEFAVQGPVRLQVMARNLFAAEGAAPIRLHLELDGKAVKTLRRRPRRARRRRWRKVVRWALSIA